jgi:hypothetical protein
MKKTLLCIDGIANLVIGAVLLLFPAGMLQLLGLPAVSHHFYTSILGAVILGIGLALFVELLSGPKSARGLGLAGAIAINLCGGGALLGWLVLSPFELPVRGHVILWTTATVVVGIGVVELVSGSWKED